MTRVERGDGWEMRLGRWQDVLADVKPDALITDPPYGARTHAGHNGQAVALNERNGANQGTLGYAHMTPDDVVEIVTSWSWRVSGWLACMTSHDLAVPYLDAMDAAGRCSFAPLPVIQKRPRIRGDGPSSWTAWMCVARPRSKEAAACGTLPGAYTGPTVKGSGVIGAKPLELMRAIVRDYSEPGDLVCDPFAGSGTTLLAAVTEGRRAIGAEMDEGRFNITVRRLRAGHTPPLFTEED